ncbi:DUF2169 domain-containing protein [Ralstonia pseudosolanacearum]|uniref:DUF2169 family type VI secretion system accessory protein n=1 Tax=Ralstonia solanacearum species complex TaxID=3116862 RepID=UPI00200367B8|nr:DUF2169 domain-containing protein [Ralstonia pseudosolanacearum]MCK4125644.1 DUF2169 domain-containing protein [Ralstonia pseudosolanacearum]
MEFVNHTPFPALAFAGIDQFNQSFQVVALRQTFTWGDTGELEYAEVQAPLCESDDYFGTSFQGSVRQESDLCPYKPRCDVIVNATAYPPQRPHGGAPGRFAIQLVVSRPSAPAPLPPEPYGLNPLMLASPEEMQAWRVDVERARNSVPRKHRLTQEQADGHPDAPSSPAAHDAYHPNPAGRGFVRDWYLQASGTNAVPAAQIEYPDRPVALKHFNRIRAGELGWDVPVAGLGVRPKGHPDRAKLVGTVDREFIEGGAPLPQDFDFAVWNAAWPDQQVDSLKGDETVELTNLCAPDTPGARVDAQGNSFLRLQLKPMRCMLVVRMESGFMFLHPMKIDTLLVEPEHRRLTLVWRAALGDVEPIRKVETQLFGANEQAFMEQIATVTKQRMAGQHAHQGERG